MTSNIRIDKTCEHCGGVFTARTTVTRFCSKICADRAGKVKLRNAKIAAAKETPLSVLKKEVLTVQEAALFLGISRRTAYRLVISGKIPAVNLGDRLIRIQRTTLNKLLNGE